MFKKLLLLALAVLFTFDPTTCRALANFGAATSVSPETSAFDAQALQARVITAPLLIRLTSSGPQVALNLVPLLYGMQSADPAHSSGPALVAILVAWATGIIGGGLLGFALRSYLGSGSFRTKRYDDPLVAILKQTPDDRSRESAVIGAVASLLSIAAGHLIPDLMGLNVALITVAASFVVGFIYRPFSPQESAYELPESVKGIVIGISMVAVTLFWVYLIVAIITGESAGGVLQGSLVTLGTHQFINRKFGEAFVKLFTHLRLAGFQVPLLNVATRWIDIDRLVREARRPVETKEGLSIRVSSEKVRIPLSGLRKGHDVRISFRIVVNPDFPGDHVGRDSLTIMATDEPMAAHALTELKLAIGFAVYQKIASLEDVRKGRLGKKYRAWLKAESPNLREERVMQLIPLLERWHQQGIRSELVKREPAFAALREVTWQWLLPQVSVLRRLDPAAVPYDEDRRWARIIIDLSRRHFRSEVGALKGDRSAALNRMMAAIRLRPRKLLSEISEETLLDPRTQPDFTLGSPAPRPSLSST